MASRFPVAMTPSNEIKKINFAFLLERRPPWNAMDVEGGAAALLAPTQLPVQVQSNDDVCSLNITCQASTPCQWRQTPDEHITVNRTRPKSQWRLTDGRGEIAYALLNCLFARRNAMNRCSMISNPSINSTP